MIEISDLEKSFGSHAAVRKVTLGIPEGSFFCLLGPSGCGKTTLLRLLAGLERPDHGLIRIRGQAMNDLEPHRRNCAMVFQNYALWPHLSVGENIAYGLRVRKHPAAEIRESLKSLYSTFRLEGLGDRMPHELSGGQQQRVALARAMAVKPAVILMDEPLSNLDAGLRKSLRKELSEFHRKEKATIVYVTHDQEEALSLGDRIAIMKEGRIIEAGRPEDLYDRPGSLDTALFLGEMNVLQGAVSSGSGLFHCAGLPMVDTGGRMTGGKMMGGKNPSTLCIRPEYVRLWRNGDPEDGPGILEGKIAFTEYLGSHMNIHADTPAGTVLCTVHHLFSGRFPPGIVVRLFFPPEHCLLY